MDSFSLNPHDNVIRWSFFFSSFLNDCFAFQRRKGPRVELRRGMQREPRREVTKVTCIKKRRTKGNPSPLVSRSNILWLSVLHSWQNLISTGWQQESWRYRWCTSTVGTYLPVTKYICTYLLYLEYLLSRYLRSQVSLSKVLYSLR